MASQRPARGQHRARRGEFVFPSMPFAIGMFIISKNWSFRDGTQPPQMSATGGSSQCPPGSWRRGPSRMPCPSSRSHRATWILRPTGLSRGSAGCLSQASVPPAGTASLGQERAALLLSLLCGDSISRSSHFCFWGRKQNKIQKSPAPAKRLSSSDLGGIYFPLFPIALLSGSVPLHSCPPWAPAQKHCTNPPLSYLPLLNYFISFL